MLAFMIALMVVIVMVFYSIFHSIPYRRKILKFQKRIESISILYDKLINVKMHFADFLSSL